MLLVKDCNYTDGDRQLRDQFVYGIADDELKKRLLEKGNTLTRIDATTIGKTYETRGSGMLLKTTSQREHQSCV